MAYSILFTDPKQVSHERALSFDTTFRNLIEHDGRFTVRAFSHVSTYKGLPRNSPTPRRRIELSGIRLKTKKLYCGQHPGSCEFPDRPKPVSSILEWDDWVAFHGLLNDLLDSEGLRADVWSSPQDAKGKFWIRRQNRARIEFRWEEYDNAGRPGRRWDRGLNVDDGQYAPLKEGAEDAV